MKKNSDILQDVADYYSARIRQYGATPQGVDWNGRHSQNLRFEQLAKIFGRDNSFSVNDIGCGYGAFADFLTERYEKFTYTGIDIAAEMITAAHEKYKNIQYLSFVNAAKPQHVADYAVASGIFNVSQERADEEWLNYIEGTLAILDKFSVRGFSFNCLTSYSDKDKMRKYLYYANPCYFFDLCKKKYSCHVALLHDYGLYEFTMLVRKVS